MSIFCWREGRNEGRAIVSVIPTVTISVHRVPSLQLAILICHVQRFYPEVIQITWLEMNRSIKAYETSAPTKDPDGTFNQDSRILVYISEDRAPFTCQVEQEAQPLIPASIPLSEFREESACLGDRGSGVDVEGVITGGGKPVKVQTWTQTGQVHMLALPCLSCVTLRKSLPLSVPQFLLL